MKHVLLVNARAPKEKKVVTTLLPAIAVERVVYPMSEGKPMHVRIAGHDGYLQIDGLRVFETFEAALMDDSAPAGALPASGATLGGWERLRAEEEASES